MTERIRAWHPALPSVREVYHAAFAHAYPLHAHDGWAVMLVDDGAVAYDLGRTGHVATRQAVTLLPPGIPHDGRPAVEGGSYRKRVLYLDSDWLPERTPGVAAGRPTIADAGALGDARRIHAALREPGDLMAAEHWTLALQRRIRSHLGDPAGSSRDVPIARRARALIDARFTETFTIAEMADELGAHPSHLARVFSQTYGVAPHQYVVSRRVDLARRLLVDGSRPAIAAADAGFHDQAHMSRHFRRILGATPGEFARRRDR